MNPPADDAKLRAALDHLRSRGPCGGLETFEREVWAEIAVRDLPRSAGMFTWFREGFGLPFPVAAPACALIAVVCGAILALDRAEVYEAHESAALERSYVALIHPVMRSQTHAATLHREH